MNNSYTSPIFSKLYNDFIDSGLLADLHGNHLKLLLAICSHVDGKGIAFVSQETLCKEAGFTDGAHVRKWLTHKESGLLHYRFNGEHVIELKDTGRNPLGQPYNIYRILPPSRLGKFEFNSHEATGTDIPLDSEAIGTKIKSHRYKSTYPTGTDIPPNKNKQKNKDNIKNGFAENLNGKDKDKTVGTNKKEEEELNRMVERLGGSR
ncbi:helix-turn-helix domain-containing protein [Paenibacillus solisilvae]|uniref:Helix-turn-helix domain-containing protein n=1 Tax=Paenibacillus solisilvae TaxID=2486751 RepID=A0ABW0VPW9_9BACL